MYVSRQRSSCFSNSERLIKDSLSERNAHKYSRETANVGEQDLHCERHLSPRAYFKIGLAVDSLGSCVQYVVKRLRFLVSSCHQ